MNWTRNVPILLCVLAGPGEALADLAFEASYTQTYFFAPTYYRNTSSLIVGYGTDGVTQADARTFVGFDLASLPGPVTAIEVTGEVDNLRIHPNFSVIPPPYGAGGLYANLSLYIGGFTATAIDPASLYAVPLVSGAFTTVDDGIILPDGPPPVGPSSPSRSTPGPWRWRSRTGSPGRRSPWNSRGTGKARSGPPSSAT